LLLLREMGFGRGRKRASDIPSTVLISWDGGGEQEGRGGEEEEERAESG
jgi:hypothetical protein